MICDIECGSVFGEISPLYRIPSENTFFALQNCLVLELEVGDYEQLLQLLPPTPRAALQAKQNNYNNNNNRNISLTQEEKRNNKKYIITATDYKKQKQNNPPTSLFPSTLPSCPPDRPP